MDDPPRLVSRTGSPEALLLDSVQGGEPPAFAEEELWRRLRSATGGAAIGATTVLAAHEAAAVGAKVVGHSLWVSVVKWGAVVAIAAPVVGVVAQRGLARRTPIVRPPTAAAPAVATNGIETLEAVDQAPRASEPSAPHGGRAAAASMSASALRAESRLLESARAKLAAGDADAALQDIAKLGVQFPHGRLIPEREVVAIDSLEMHGDRAAARARGVSFLAQFPSSPYAAHVRQRLQPVER